MDTYNLMEVKLNSIELSCYACPTIFEWKDKYNNKYYFRLRHGYWHIVDENNGDVIVSGTSDDGSDGVCNWEDVKRYAMKENFIIIGI